MARPTHKALTKKIKKARAFVKNDQVSLINQTALAVDALELEYSIEDDLWEVFNELLEETDPNHYIGTRPPQRSYEDAISGLELITFVVEIERFSQRVYYKFLI